MIPLDRLRAPLRDDLAHLGLQADGASSPFHVSQRSFGIGSIGRIDEHCHTSHAGHQLTQEFQPLCHQLTTENIDTRRVPPGRARVATRPSLTGSSLTPKTMGIVEVAALAANVEGVPTGEAITATCRRANSSASAGN